MKDKWLISKVNALTLKRLAVLGSMTFLISRTSCAKEEPTCPCLMMKDLGTPSAARGFDAAPPLRCVLFFRRLAIAEEWRRDV